MKIKFLIIAFICFLLSGMSVMAQSAPLQSVQSKSTVSSLYQPTQQVRLQGSYSSSISKKEMSSLSAGIQSNNSPIGDYVLGAFCLFGALYAVYGAVQFRRESSVNSEQ